MFVPASPHPEITADLGEAAHDLAAAQAVVEAGASMGIRTIFGQMDWEGQRWFAAALSDADYERRLAAENEILESIHERAGRSAETFQSRRKLSWGVLRGTLTYHEGESAQQAAVASQTKFFNSLFESLL